MTTKTGRNERCPCGSGKKYKQCCLARPSSAALLHAARTQHDAGNLPAAAKLYEQVLQAEPKNVDALHCLGILAGQVGDAQTAMRMIGVAITLAPLNPHLHNTQGNLFLQQGEYATATTSFRHVVSLDPQHVDALCNLGIALQAQHRNDEAAACYEKALALKPEHAQAHNNVGNLYLAQGKLEQASERYRKALNVNPRYADAHYNLGNTQQQQGRLEDAVESYRNAISCRPEFAEAHNNLGVALRQLGSVDEAVASFRNASSLRPGYADAINNLGVALQDLGRLAEAVECYRRLIALQPQYADAHYNLGSALYELDRIDEAIACYRQALDVRPDFLPAYSNLLYTYASTCCVSPQEERAAAEGWERAALKEAELAAAKVRCFDPRPREGRKLRLGIVSAEIGDHAVAEFLEPLLEELDRSRFELYLYPTSIRSENRAERMQSLAENVNSLAGIPDIAAAELIRGAQIDILVDTTGHTRRCRLGIFARRAAPVQITYIGYWSTTGLSEMDWFLGDASLPPHFDEHFRERIWRLPRVALAYRGDTGLPVSESRATDDGIVWLGSFNRYAKIRGETLRLWAKVLQAIPNAKLLLEDRNLNDSDSHRRILGGLAQYGIEADRVEFEPFVPGHERHMRLYERLDIALDTIPFNSGTTACDALWMGVPLVTLAGNRSAGTIASSFLQTIQRPEWIAHSEDEYVAIVVKLSKDIHERQQIRTSQRIRMAESPLCDAVGLARALEEAFEQMFDQWSERRES